MKSTLEKMKEYREISLGREEVEAELLEEMTKKFPNLEKVTFSEYAIEVNTQKHTMRLTNWGSLKRFEPLFVCSDKTMPDTVEGFLKAKAFIEEDRNQCMTAFYWLFNRYDFGYVYGYKNVGK